MMTLTFGEQVKIVLSRKNMTIKQLAELIEEQTGTKMSRQNLTQRLGRDNFQEQDMRMIAEILGCSFELSILDNLEVPKKTPEKKTVKEELPITIVETTDSETERDMTIGELQDIMEETKVKRSIKDRVSEVESPKVSRKNSDPDFIEDDEIDTQSNISKQGNDKKPAEEIQGEINPYTGKEYQSNSVRVHPKRIGYVQVYDQSNHKWTDMTEWAFLGYQERKKALLGKEYEPPIYLD